ncbi:MAG: hypothetical protein HETSPECPRED_006998 [Heterodermia speciosa]|uniref:SnoaL-like domain-containing protein n=1 Tax=Heterodermia speciosa TaxID=116794 RepID=A0A8H3IB10_9LECA|nr:MAG: hypothetical protein HETSPECPRED_006998 [Heterodermia speciosa]
MTHSRVVLTAEDDAFDPVTIQSWKDEGFQVAYLPFRGRRKEYIEEINSLPDPLELGEKYAIVAYGEAASVVLELAQKPMPKLCALVAYYPDRPPQNINAFPPSLEVCVHLAEAQPVGVRYKSYVYAESKPGFAESDLEDFDERNADLAWTRTLGLVRKALDQDVDLEAIWEKHVGLEFATKDADATMSTMVADPYVNHIPTLTGGVGYEALHRFYRDYFIPGNPPSLRMRLVSRTVGVNRVVDEMHVSFRHTQEIPWMLPGIGPTDKEVEVALVAVVCIRGGKLYHEHIYWDQASVLMQIGLLDPTLVPGSKAKQHLPIVGREGARKVLDKHSTQSNQLIPGW